MAFSFYVRAPLESEIVLRTVLLLIQQNGEHITRILLKGETFRFRHSPLCKYLRKELSPCPIHLNLPVVKTLACQKTIRLCGVRRRSAVLTRKRASEGQAQRFCGWSNRVRHGEAASFASQVSLLGKAAARCRTPHRFETQVCACASPTAFAPLRFNRVRTQRRKWKVVGLFLKLYRA